MKRQLSFLGLAVVLSLLLNACGSSTASKTPEKSPTNSESADLGNAGANSVTYPVVTVRASTPVNQLTLPGELMSYYETDLYAKVNGYIRRMRADIGDRVRAGQVLVELEAPELVAQQADAFAQVKNAEAQLTADRSTYRRLMQAARTPGAVSPYDLDVARGKVVGDSLTRVGAQAKYEAAEQTLGYLRIRAPFDGIVTDRKLAPGAFVGPNDRAGLPILKIKQESRLRLQVAIPEKDVDNVRQGQTIQFSVTSFPGQRFSGHVGRISSTIQREVRAEIVEIEVPNPGNKLVPGMFAQVTLPTRRTKPSLVVPSTAVVTTMEKCFVVRVDHGKTQWVDVQKGSESNGEVEVFGSLRAGDTVLKTASEELRPGTAVKTELAAR